MVYVCIHCIILQTWLTNNLGDNMGDKGIINGLTLGDKNKMVDKVYRLPANNAGYHILRNNAVIIVRICELIRRGTVALFYIIAGRVFTD